LEQDRVKAGKALSREEREMFAAAFKVLAADSFDCDCL
jgi:uncharacterized membrane protein